MNDDNNGDDDRPSKRKLEEFQVPVSGEEEPNVKRIKVETAELEAVPSAVNEIGSVRPLDTPHPESEPSKQEEVIVMETPGDILGAPVS